MRITKTVRIKESVAFTKNTMRADESIAGRTLKVIDEACDKSCFLCVVDDDYLIEVDVRDVALVIDAPDTFDLFMHFVE